MEKANIQSTEKNIVSVALANIQPSSYNPRKNFDEASLAELAESIRRQGVLQPIGVRPMADDRFEIVFGERRYRASLMAGLEEIPAIVMEISDEAAEEMAITENLQRQDVTPMEEANAYQKLIESGRYDVQALTAQFGKSENYIRTRLKFVSLIPEIAQLLEQDEITISVATEICRYGADIQQQVYEKHLKEANAYNSWRGLKAAEVAKYIERNYTTDLSRYSFDKTLCASCPHNTNNMMLFCEGGCGNCSNRTCLAEMNASFLVEKAVQMSAEYPIALFGYRKYNCNETAVERLSALGYEVEALVSQPYKYPAEPAAPEKDDFDTPEQYEAARADYRQEMDDYKEECDNLVRAAENGEIGIYLMIGQSQIGLYYTEIGQDEDGTPTVSGQKQITPIEKLEKQDKRNKEIALEKTVADTKKQILEVDLSESKFTADEDKMIYFFLLSSLRREHFEAVGIEGKSSYDSLTGEEKLHIIANLTAKQKAIIRRDFLIANFKDAYGNGAIASLLLDFARKHMPETLAAIESGYNEVYEKRHKRIEERKAVLMVQEQAKQEETAETGEAQPVTEVRPETHPQPEEAAA